MFNQKKYVCLLSVVFILLSACVRNDNLSAEKEQIKLMEIADNVLEDEHRLKRNNSLVEFFILLWAYMVFIGPVILGPAALIFYYYGIKKIILLLNEYDFIDMSNRFNNIVCNIGRLRPYGFSKDGTIYDKAWGDFRKMKIPKEQKTLYRFQFIAKIIYRASFIYVLFFLSLPVFIIGYSFFYLISLRM